MRANRIAIGVVVLVLVVCAAGTWYTRNLIARELAYKAPTTEAQIPPFPYRNVTLTASDGIHIGAWYIPAAHPKAGIVLVHGFAPKGGRAAMLPEAIFLVSNGYSVLIVDLRSDGALPVKLGITEWKDAVAAYAYLRSQPELNGKLIGYLGESAGASTAIIASAKTGKGDFIIADAPYASIDRTLEYRASAEYAEPTWLVNLFVRVAAFSYFGWNYASVAPEKLIAALHIPMLIMWSDNDAYIGPNQGEVVYANANQPKHSWVAHAGHDIAKNASQEFQAQVLDFLGKVAP